MLVSDNAADQIQTTLRAIEELEKRRKSAVQHRPIGRRTRQAGRAGKIRPHAARANSWPPTAP